MSTSSRTSGSPQQAGSAGEGAPSVTVGSDAQLSRWGGVAALAGVASMLGAFVVVAAAGLPDASDPETLTDFADIESGRIAEHLFYLGAVVLFALHTAVLHRLLATGHRAAALFGTVIAMFGLVIMAAGSLLHVSTSPLAELYEAPAASPGDRRSIEFAWHGAQSVFDTMLATGILLVPVGLVLLGVAMWRSPSFGHRLAASAIAFGILGTVGATISVVDAGSDASALGVLAVTAFFLGSGWHTLRHGDGVAAAPTEDPAPWREGHR